MSLRLAPSALTQPRSGLHNPHLHCIDDVFTDEDRADDYYGGACAQTVLLNQTFERRLNRVFRIDHVEGNNEWRDSPAQGEAAGDVVERAQGVNRRVTRTQPAGTPSHATMARE